MGRTAPIGRPRRSRLYIIAGISLAVLAFLAAAGLASAPYLFPASNSGTKVVVAKTAIAARTRIDASELTLSVITPVPPQSFTSIPAVGGEHEPDRPDDGVRCRVPLLAAQQCGPEVRARIVEGLRNSAHRAGPELPVGDQRRRRGSEAGGQQMEVHPAVGS